MHGSTPRAAQYRQTSERVEITNVHILVLFAHYVVIIIKEYLFRIISNDRVTPERDLSLTS